MPIRHLSPRPPSAPSAPIPTCAARPAPGAAAAAPLLPLSRPDLPPLDELLPLLRDLWDSRLLTNAARHHADFERALQRRLQVAHFSLFANATLALLAALRALDLSGEVVTSPFTFVATLNALRWAGLTPVFADIDPRTLTLDPRATEAAITPRTTALLPVHALGQACDVDAFDAVAARHGLRLVYDAAPAVGMQVGGRSLLARGDAAVVSFHATKVLNTFEGGAVACAEPGLRDRLRRLRNHGLDDNGQVPEAGLNAKMSEFNAALGVLQLDRLAGAIAQRGQVDRAYREALRDVPGIACVAPRAGVASNFAYFPILVGGDDHPLTRDALWRLLQANGIDARRYYHPLGCDLAAFREWAPRDPAVLAVARRCAAQVLCLPIHPALTAAEQGRIVDLVASAGRQVAAW